MNPIMSATDLTTTPLTPAPARAAVARDGPPAGGVSLASWSRVGLAVALLIGSAGVRAWQVRRIDGEMAAGRQRPKIDLAAVPTELGPWKGAATELDAQIARATGADQIVTRRYVNQFTGVALDLILIYGPAAEVYVHAPEVCYPSAGYALAAGPEARAVKLGDGGAAADFRSLVYAKGEGATAALSEVYYSWWYNGRWTPEVGKQKYFERIPGMYKVHVARVVGPGERRDVDNPSESFLRELLPELRRRMAARLAPAPAP